ncbi:hypothetical protein PRJ_3549 [Pseudomonas sp. XWY-1]|uniref:Uncharacterized protein n=1 Tax=Pseudomonas putida (strain DOT-T1E) TaxID=1196325 RepID=I7BHA2_PSEPT|nr:hypothetical protein T1E_5342 [Pseudomonas putida DOT-T1E]AUZ60148.1 hypothetical protein PRJ_3549 [Pseudomonas sp. XWY-1]
MRCRGFVGRPTRVARNPYRSCFQSFTPAERGLMRAGAGMRGMHGPGQRRSTGSTVLVTL